MHPAGNPEGNAIMVDRYKQHHEKQNNGWLHVTAVCPWPRMSVHPEGVEKPNLRELTAYLELRRNHTTSTQQGQFTQCKYLISH
jgi:hypothetical protein